MPSGALSALGLFHLLGLAGAATRDLPQWHRLGSGKYRPGQIFDIAFIADNPGIWMDHCHNFEHAAKGMIMHRACADVVPGQAL